MLWLMMIVAFAVLLFILPAMFWLIAMLAIVGMAEDDPPSYSYEDD